jgi:hypothetical protein
MLIIYDETKVEPLITLLRDLKMYFYESQMSDFDKKYLLIGFDTKANLIEVMYNIVDNNVINVFHAMPCRKSFRELIDFSRSRIWL